MLARFRRTGADLPFGDPRRAHGVAFEGWYWRLTDAARGTVLVVLVGINRSEQGLWATLGVAAHPGGFTRALAVMEAEVSPDGRRIRAGDALLVEDDMLRVCLPDSTVEISLHDQVTWPGGVFGGIGPAQVVPGLSQYWHPWLLHATVRGSVSLAGHEIELDGASAYAEKNWGAGGFPATWWWGQAHGFGDDDVCVAFAGGRAGLGPLHTTATSLVVRLGDDVRRIVKPLQRLHVDVTRDRWLLRGGGIELEGHANGTAPHMLPVPLPRERRNLEGAAAQHLAGELRLSVTKRGRRQFEGVSSLAGLERGNGQPRPSA